MSDNCLKYKIGIVGNGFVGSAIAVGFSLHAHVKVFDKNPLKSINTLSETINESEFVFISVPTPMKNDSAEIDLTIMDGVIEDIMNAPKSDNFSYEKTIFIIKSTVVPGTTKKYAEKYPNLRFVFNPEFLTERSANLDFINASRIVLGGAQDDINRVANLYRTRFPYTKIIKTDSCSAEFVKYMCNCFFATKISFMNEMKQYTDTFNISWDDVMNGFVSDGRIGNSHLDVPGHDGNRGFGGKCFPKDLNAFIYEFNKANIEPTILNAVWEKNMKVRKNYDWLNIDGATS